MIIDNGTTEDDLFERILADGGVEEYDPDKHLIADVAALRWRVTPKNALSRLRALAVENDLVECKVKSLDTGRTITAFRRK